MHWLRYTKEEAGRQLDKLTHGEAPVELPAEYQELKAALEDAYNSVLEEIRDFDDTREFYPFDLRFALKLYTILDAKGFSLWEAADDGIWAFLSISVIPNIVKWRCKEEYTQNRFYSYSRSWHIRLKMLWWYIFLSMTEENGTIDVKETFESLKDHSSDNINQLLDRSGTGFRIEFCRNLMKRYSQVANDEELTGEKRKKFFQRIIRQTHLRSLNIDPDLCSASRFIDEIFKICESKTGETENANA